MRLSIDIPHDTLAYLEASARLRHVSPTALARKVLYVVMRDQFVLSVLDDAHEIVQAKPLTHVQQARHDERAAKVRAREAKAAAQKERVANVQKRTQYNPQLVFRKPAAMTKSELQRELQQAVLNTASLPVE